MSVEGAITVDISLARGEVDDVRISSSRRVDACRALVGLPIDAALTSVPLLFSVCAEAQSIAARAACEAALGVERTAAQRTADELRLVTEAIDNHALQVALKWPALSGGEPRAEPLRAIRAATGRLRRGNGTPAALATELTAHLHELCGDLPPAAGELAAWSRGATVAQRTIAAIVGSGLSDFGRCNVPLLHELPPAWFDAQTAGDPKFEWAPTHDGRTAETGSLARWAAHPLLAELRARHGNGLLTRFVARLVDLDELAGRVEVLAREPAATTTRAPLAGSGHGAAVVDTARGTLAHVVTIEDSCLTGWRVVAPTEWNFHPAGPLVRGLLGASAKDIERNAGLVVASLDPCVGFELRVR